MATHIQDIVTADAEMSNIKSVRLNLKNVKVTELTDMDIAQALTHTDQRCLRAIQRRREQGFDVTLISSAIQADLIYTVSFERTSKMSVDAKVAAVQNLSAKLGVDASRTSDSAIEGQGLIFGIRSDEYLAWQLVPDHLPKADRGSSILSSDTQQELEVMLGNPTRVPAPQEHAEPMPDVPEDVPAATPPPPAVPVEAAVRDAETAPEITPQEFYEMLPRPRPQAVPRRSENRHSTIF